MTLKLTYGGRTLSVHAWAKALGIHPNTLRKRIKAGWDVEDALTRSTMGVNQTRVRKLSLEDRRVLRDMRKDGFKVAYIAKVLGVSTVTVYRVLQAKEDPVDHYAAYSPSRAGVLNGQDQL